MSIHVLPHQLNLEQAAIAGHQFRGNLCLAGMERLKELVANDENDIQVELFFGVDEQGFRYLQGHLLTSLNLVCQRCLKDFVYGIDAYFRLSPIQSEDDLRLLPENYEPIMTIGNPIIEVKALIEDELILNLPIVPMHDIGKCEAGKLLQSINQQADQEVKPNPFHVLRNLKKEN